MAHGEHLAAHSYAPSDVPIYRTGAFFLHRSTFEKRRSPVPIITGQLLRHPAQATDDRACRGDVLNASSGARASTAIQRTTVQQRRVHRPKSIRRYPISCTPLSSRSIPTPKPVKLSSRRRHRPGRRPARMARQYHIPFYQASNGRSILNMEPSRSPSVRHPYPRGPAASLNRNCYRPS